MTDGPKRLGIPLSYSVLLHVVIVALFFITISETPTTFKAPLEPETITATVLDESKVKAEVDRLKKQEQDERRSEQLRQRRVEEARKQETQRLAELKRQNKAEEQRAREAAEKRKLEQAEDVKQIALLKKQKQDEENRLEDIRKKKQEAEKERKDEEKRLLELAEKRKLEAKKQQQIKQRKEVEREAAEQRLAEQKKRQAEAEIERAAASNRANKAITDAKVLIQQKVDRNWLRPPATAQGLSCRIQVKLIPGGEVVDARVIRGSGNTAFDRSAESAVRKASPLPLPTDPELFSPFRNFDFEFKPDA